MKLLQALQSKIFDLKAINQRINVWHLTAEEVILIPVEKPEFSSELIRFIAEVHEKTQRVVLLLPSVVEESVLVWAALMPVDGVCMADKVNADAAAQIKADFYAFPPHSSIEPENSAIKDHLITVDGEA